MPSTPSRLVDRLQGVALDLDGTLIDSVPDLAAATNAMLESCDARAITEAQVAEFVGGGIEVLATRALTLALGSTPDPQLLARGLARFQSYYGRHLFERSRVFDGVVPALEALRSEGLTLCCVTNKAAVFAEPLLAAAQIDRFLYRTFCAGRPEDRKPGPALLLRACEALNVEPAQLLCVGDSRADVGAARAAGCPVAAVDYGYHHGELQREYAPDWLISALTDIVDLPATGPKPRPAIEGSRPC